MDLRALRVRRFKRIIITTIMLLILLPTILCVVLFWQMNKLQRQLNELAISRTGQKTVLEAASEIKEGEDGPIIQKALEEWKELPINASSPEGDSLEDSSVNYDYDIKTISNEEVSVEETSDGEISEGKTSEDGPKDSETIEKKKVYLTFDDGPSANTGKILDILDKYNIKATFFVVGTENEAFKKYYKEIIDRGHAIGMHSYSHVYSEIYASEDSFLSDLSKIRKLIYQEAGVTTDLYRFPGGSSNTVSKVPMPELINTLDSFDIRFFDWNVSSKDATTQLLDTGSIVSNCLYGINDTEEDAVVLLHDLSNKTTTVEALPIIIENLLNREDIELCSITEDTKVIHHN